jgi:hypothetical protein
VPLFDDEMNRPPFGKLVMSRTLVSSSDGCRVPMGICVDNMKNIYYTDYLTHTVRKLSLEGKVSVVAGEIEYAHGYRDGDDALFFCPMGICVDSQGFFMSLIMVMI